MPSWKRIEQRKSPSTCTASTKVLSVSSRVLSWGNQRQRLVRFWLPIGQDFWSSMIIKCHLPAKQKHLLPVFWVALQKSSFCWDFLHWKIQRFLLVSVLQCFAQCDCSSSDLQVLASSDFSPKRLAIPGIPNSSVFIFKRGGFRNFSKVWWSTNLKNVEWRVNSLKETPFGVLSTSDLRHDQGQHTLVLKQKGLGTTFYLIGRHDMVSEGWSQRYIWTNLLSTIVRNEISMAHAEVGMKGSNLKNSKQTNSTSAILPIRLAFPLTLGHPTIHHPFLVTRDFNISMALAEAAPPRQNIMKTLEFNQHLSGDLDISFPPAHGIISKIFNLQTSKEDPNIHWKEVWRCCNLGLNPSFPQSRRYWPIQSSSLSHLL